MVWVWDRSIEWDIKVSEADNKHIWLQGTFLPCVPGGLFSGAGYIVRFNRESGDGRPDIILLDRNTGYAAVFELKLADSPEDMRNAADRAIAQLKECEYGSDLFDYDRIIGFDISFFRKRALARTADMEQYTGNITRQEWSSHCSETMVCIHVEAWQGGVFYGNQWLNWAGCGYHHDLVYLISHSGISFRWLLLFFCIPHPVPSGFQEFPICDDQRP